MFLFLVNDFIIDLACYNKTALLFESSVAKINIFLQKKPALTFSVKQKHIQSEKLEFKFYSAYVVVI